MHPRRLCGQTHPGTACIGGAPAHPATPSRVSPSEAARATNVRGVAVADPFAIARRRIVLVDDVRDRRHRDRMCRARTAGAAAVDVLTLARAVRC
jgi:hypothetical protein